MDDSNEDRRALEIATYVILIKYMRAVARFNELDLFMMAHAPLLGVMRPMDRDFRLELIRPEPDCPSSGELRAPVGAIGLSRDA